MNCYYHNNSRPTVKEIKHDTVVPSTVYFLYRHRGRVSSDWLDSSDLPGASKLKLCSVG